LDNGFTPNTPQGDGNTLTASAIFSSIILPNCFTPNTPQGDGNVAAVGGVFYCCCTTAIAVSRLTPRKGTETFVTRAETTGSEERLLCFTPNTPQGDGNRRKQS
jgi:hypothetical protein